MPSPQKIICFCTSPCFCHNTRMRAAIRHTRARQRVKRWQTMRGSRNENLSKLEMIRQLWQRITAPRHVHLWVACRDARKRANIECVSTQVCCEAQKQANIHGLKPTEEVCDRTTCFKVDYKAIKKRDDCRVQPVNFSVRDFSFKWFQQNNNAEITKHQGRLPDFELPSNFNYLQLFTGTRLLPLMRMFACSV